MIRSGKLQLYKEEESLINLVEEVIHFNRVNAARKNISIVVEYKAERDYLKCDTQKVKQVIDNLVSNAVKFSFPGTTVKVLLQSINGGVSLSVIDQGPGIPDDEQHHIFQDFGRTSVQPTGGEKSTGLGLAICRYIVKAHGGSISFQNMPNVGCKFSVLFPLDN